MKKLIIGKIVRFIMGGIAFGTGIWYLSSSIGGASLSYVSMDTFMNSIGASDGNVASVNGCFMCRYINDLFMVLGGAAEGFWKKIWDYLWILMAVGFVIFLFVHTIKHLMNAAKETAKLDNSEKKFDFKSWFDTVWRQAVKIMIAGAVLGAFSMGGTKSLKMLSDITIEPVMYVGTSLSMTATGVSDVAQCSLGFENPEDANNPMSGVSKSFMCIIGNVNSVMLAGASGGFALMNYSWMGLGGGVLTWVVGLIVVIMFLIVGFDLFFQLLSVVFKLVFLVIFLPFFVAAWAFEKTWKMASGVVGGAIKMLVGSALKVIAITLKVVILYATVYFATDMYFPGPVDNFSVMMPPMLGVTQKNLDAEALSVKKVFETCEKRSLVNNVVDADKFVACYNSEKSRVEAKYRHAFDFVDDAWGFLLFMICLFFIYMYVISPKIDALLAETNIGSGTFDDFGENLKKMGKGAWNKPTQVAEKLSDELGGYSWKEAEKLAGGAKK
ncbi:MAG: hypothetical protein K5912_00360 [Alphaproteobacteria bacterium]|nr:hypothetical protein [Alphaproteobacteria bacterium]